MTVKGIDVSSYQSTSYSTAGLSFVIVKATEGTSYVNPSMAAQAARGRSAGLVVGFYHFLHPGNPKGQAAYFVEKCASREGDILACDWEPTNSGTPSNSDKDTFIKEVKRLRPDHKVLLYCDVARWTGVDKTSYCGDGLWIAQYNGHPGKPSIRAPWLIHQYTSSPLDTNVADFASTAAMRTWATGGKTTTTSSNSSKEPDMDEKQVNAAVWDQDSMPAPPSASTYKTNKTWKASSYFKELYERIHELTLMVQAQSATVDKLADALGSADGFDPESLKREIRDAIESVTVRLDTGA